jgi:hypothetical protein
MGRATWRGFLVQSLRPSEKLRPDLRRVVAPPGAVKCCSSSLTVSSDDDGVRC